MIYAQLPKPLIFFLVLYFIYPSAAALGAFVMEAAFTLFFIYFFILKKGEGELEVNSIKYSILYPNFPITANSLVYENALTRMGFRAFAFWLLYVGYAIPEIAYSIIIITILYEDGGEDPV